MSKIVNVILVLIVIAATAGGLQFLKTHQRLGEPGVRVKPVPLLDTEGNVIAKESIPLPESVSGFTSTQAPMAKLELETLPKDTTFGRRMYLGSNGYPIVASVVLMGTDRTSIHKPEICLTCQGWNPELAEQITIRMDRPYAYDLPVMKMPVKRYMMDDNGRPVILSGYYLFWFVSADHVTAAHGNRVWSISKTLLSQGILERWAYISYLAPCAPGDEAGALERARKLIQATAPDFQIPAGPPFSGSMAASVR